MSIDLLTVPDEKLEEMIKSLGEDAILPAGRPSRQTKIDAIKKGTIRKEIRFQDEVRAELQVKAREKLGSTPSQSKKRLNPETVAIQASKLVKAKFHNRENPPTPEGEAGADIRFDKGSYHFHLYDEQTYALPEVMVSDNPLSCKESKDALIEFFTAPWPKQTPLSVPDAKASAESILRSINLCYENSDHQTPCTGPKHRKVKLDVDNVKEGFPISYDVAEKRGFCRFGFSVSGDAPEGAVIGSLLD